MNLIGKIFIVLIFVMSLVFMSFVVAVYAAHTNWREVVLRPQEEASSTAPLGLKFQLEQAKEDSQELQDRLDVAEKELAAEQRARSKVLQELESEVDTLTRERDLQEKDLALLQQEVRDARAALEAAHNTLASLRKEVDGLRVDIRQAQQDRDKYFDEVVQTTDELHQERNKYKSLVARNESLAADMANALAVLRKFNLEADPVKYRGFPYTDVFGVVLAVRSGNMLEISIGSDDGIEKGHKLEIYRMSGDTQIYLGRVVVIETEQDRAVCQVDSSIALQGQIERGDHVATKLR